MVEYADIVPIALRWFHIAAGITWIGLLYFFNLIGASTLKSFDAQTRQRVITVQNVRALWWFRWSAAFTVLFGILLMDNMARASGGWAEFARRDSGQVIMLGGLLGIIMFLNVWLIIWPNQKKIIEASRASLESGAAAPAQQPVWARHAFLASRTNFVLSLPMLVMMVSSSHLGDRMLAVWLGVIATLGGLIWVWYLGQPAKTASAAAPAAPAAPPMK